MGMRPTIPPEQVLSLYTRISAGGEISSEPAKASTEELITPELGAGEQGEVRESDSEGKNAL
jgi:hypothetical protein